MKVISKIATVLCTLTIVWLVASTLEIGMGNLSENPSYNPLNVFVLLNK